jgi:CubicO group peptidase (beta-lactamase class C family)
MRTSRVAPFFLALISSVSSAHGLQKLDGSVVSQREVDRDVEALRRADAIPGIATALIRHGHVVYLHAFGNRSLSPDRPLTLDTTMSGASLTKALFAYLVMQLVDERRIDLDRSIASYLPRPLPEYSQYSDLRGDPRWQKLTFRILLDHTSGFANYRSFEDDRKLKFHWDPGARFGYSGEGINLAQFVLEEGLHLDIQREMQKRIFDRFRMSRSSLVWQARFTANSAAGYTAYGHAVAYERSATPHAASSLITTPRDWSKFLAGVVRGDGLTPTSKSEMIRLQIPILTTTEFPTLVAKQSSQYTAIRLGYGLGWGVFDTPFGHAFFKEGHDDGVANYALCIQRRQMCILLMSNSDRAEGIFKPLVDLLMGNTGLPWRWEGYVPFNLHKQKPPG